MKRILPLFLLAASIGCTPIRGYESGNNLDCYLGSPASCHVSFDEQHRDYQNVAPQQIVNLLPQIWAAQGYDVQHATFEQKSYQYRKVAGVLLAPGIGYSYVVRKPLAGDDAHVAREANTQVYVDNAHPGIVTVSLSIVDKRRVPYSSGYGGDNDRTLKVSYYRDFFDALDAQLGTAGVPNH